MLSTTSRQEVLRRLGVNLGYPVNEANLSSGTRHAITNLSLVQRNLSVISEILKGERSRVEKNALLSLSSRLRKDQEREAHCTRHRQGVEIATHALDRRIHLEIDQVGVLETSSFSTGAWSARGPPNTSRSEQFARCRV